MKIVFGELRKLFLKRLFLICLVLFFLANIFVLYYSQSNDYATKMFADCKGQYEELISSIKDLDAKEAKKYLDSKMTIYKIASNLCSLKSDTDKDFYNHAQILLEQYKNENPGAYKQAEKLDYTEDKLYSLMVIIQNIENDLSYIKDYDSFINEMEQRAEKQLSFSIFSSPGTFSYNNIEKTPKDFEDLKGIKLELGNNIAVENATAFTLTDFMVFALVFLICIFLFTAERDRGLYGLVRSTKLGRLPVMLSKLFVLLIITVFISIIYYSSNIFTCGLYSGFGDMNRSIQSIDIFQNCCYNLTIWQYLILWVGAKVLTMCVLASVLALVFVLIKNTAAIFIVTAAGIVGEYILFITIDKDALLNHFKYINFFYMLGGNNVLGNYLNLNFFTVPVSFTAVYLAVALLLIALSCIICCYAFVHQNQSSKNNALAPLIEKARIKLCRIRGSVSVFCGECFKHYKGSMVALVLLFLVFFAYGNLTSDIDIVYQSVQESAYSEYMDTLQGELTLEKEKYLQKQQKYFNDLYQQLSDIKYNSKMTPDEKQSKTNAIRAILEGKGAAFEEVLEQREYIKSIGEQIGQTPQYVNKLIYKRLLQNSSREWEYFTLLLAVIIFSVSNLFACEYKKGVVNLIRCTKRGKTHLVISKTLVALLTMGLSYTLIYLPYFINFINTFGAKSFNAPLIFMQEFGGINSNITIGNVVALISIVHISIAFVTVMVGLMLSNLLKNNILTMIVVSVPALFPCFMCINNEQIRLFVTLQNGSIHWLAPLIIGFCIVAGIICFAVTAVNFSKIKLRTKGRGKYGVKN